MARSLSTVDHQLVGGCGGWTPEVPKSGGIGRWRCCFALMLRDVAKLWEVPWTLPLCWSEAYNKTAFHHDIAVSVAHYRAAHGLDRSFEYVDLFTCTRRIHYTSFQGSAHADTPQACVGRETSEAIIVLLIQIVVRNVVVDTTRAVR